MTKKLEKSYDYVLIGHSLATLAFAHRLQARGESFCIIDSQQVSNSCMKEIPSLETSVYTKVPFVPFTKQVDEELNSSVLDLTGNYQKVEGTPLTFEKGDFKSFLGFGDKKIDAQDEVQRYCEPESLIFDGQPETLWQTLESRCLESIFLDQQVTDILEEDGHVQAVILNGKTKVQATHFVFFEHFSFLFEQVGQKTKSIASKVAKIRWWSSAALILHHDHKPAAAELNHCYLLMGSKEQACIGMFTQIQGQTISRWESFFPGELTQDSETVGTVVKEIKKQIQRAFSEENRPTEHIVIHSYAYGDLSHLPIQDGKVSDFNNLYISVGE